MAQTTTRPNVPVFVSSTFTDMQAYRRKVRDALTQLETIVRGMEQFGSRPGSPVAECIDVVQSCRIYIGVFGMRYGSIPDGYDKSMTHLEYDEAQRSGLPSLIYILDDNHPIPAKDVETGAGAEKLHALKEQLKKKHVVSFFTTPEDLQARIIHDVPAQLQRLGVELTGDLQRIENATDMEVLDKFDLLPKMFSGRQITIDFKLNNVRAAFSQDCAALHLEHGATVASTVLIAPGKTFTIYGEREIALKLLSLPKGTMLRATANTVFGVSRQIMFSEEDDDPIIERQAEKGLLITQLLGEDPPENA